MAGKRKDNKGRLLKAGECQRADSGKYIYTYKDLHGRRKTMYANTLPELRQKEAEIQRDLNDGINTAQADKMTLNEAFTLYMDTKTNIRKTTRSNYYRLWNSGIKDSAIGEMKLSKLKQLHIRKFYTDCIKRGLAPGTVIMYHNLINPALEMAVDSDIIRKNPAKDARKGICNQRERKVALTLDEQKKLLDFVKNSNVYKVYFPMLSLVLTTGLRVGELTGLTWSNVDMKNNVLHIRQQLIYKNLGDGSRFHITDLKTDASKRDIPLTTEARQALTEQKKLLLLLGKSKRQQETAGISDYVFTNSKGKPYIANTIDGVLKNIVTKYNADKNDADKLPHFSIHILRHTFCSRAAESGISPKTLQYIMGHSDIGVTMNVYTNLDFSKVQEEMKKVEGIV